MKDEMKASALPVAVAHLILVKATPVRRLVFLLLACSAHAADPSTTPLPNYAGAEGYSERYRVVVDLDADGHNDLLLSEAIPLFGKMGGLWNAYLWREHDYKQIGSLTAHPLAISIEPDHAQHQLDEKDRYYARIWVYLRDSGSSGGLGYYRVGAQSVQDAKGVEIYPGDGGTDLGRGLYAAVFGHSPVKFKLERSHTDAQGKITWSAYKP